MTLERINERNDETSDGWEALLTRRLTDDLDAFLENASDETFLFAEETASPRRASRNVKRPLFKALATVAASSTILVGVAAAVRFYVASPTKSDVVETTLKNDETSLLAWSVATLSDAEWSRYIETRLTNADVFGLYAATETEAASTERLGVADKKEADVEENAATESESSEWLSVKSLNDVARLEPLKYEPFLQAVAASFQ